ncbi:unnamed protein product, partial [Tetraodon nigroviridis]
SLGEGAASPRTRSRSSPEGVWLGCNPVTPGQLRANVREMEKLCSRVRPKDASALEALVQPDLKELSGLVTEFSLLVHVSTHLQHEEAFPSTCARSLPAGAFLGSSVAWQGSCERSYTPAQDGCPGPRGPLHRGETGGVQRRGGVGGRWCPRRRGATTRDASEQVENRQFTLSLPPQGWKERGQRKGVITMKS